MKSVSTNYDARDDWTDDNYDDELPPYSPVDENIEYQSEPEIQMINNHVVLFCSFDFVMLGPFSLG